MHSQEEVAIKKIANIDQKVYHEIEIHRKLDSPYVVKLIKHLMENNCCYLILEYCEEGSLSNKIMDPHQGLIYFQQILKALKYFWDNQIIHRDLKLENILVKKEQVKLIDFGFAKEITGLKCFSSKCGTPATMAPELYLADDDDKILYDGKSDVWALGVILHELVYQKHPFNGEASRLIGNKRIQLEIKDRVVENFLRRSLEPDLERRMTLDECFDHKLVCHKLCFYSTEKNDTLILPTLLTLVIFYICFSI